MGNSTSTSINTSSMTPSLTASAFTKFTKETLYSTLNRLEATELSIDKSSLLYELQQATLEYPSTGIPLFEDHQYEEGNKLWIKHYLFVYKDKCKLYPIRLDGNFSKLICSNMEIVSKETSIDKVTFTGLNEFGSQRKILLSRKWHNKNTTKFNRLLCKGALYGGDNTCHQLDFFIAHPTLYKVTMDPYNEDVTIPRVTSHDTKIPVLTEETKFPTLTDERVTPK